MYNTSSEYKSAIRKNSRYFSWGGRIKTNKGNEIPYTSRNIVGQKPKITRSCSGSTALELGSVYASELTIDLNFKEEIDRYSLYDGEITLYSYVSKSGTQAGPFEVIPMGIFEISEATRASRTISIKAYDYMLRFDKTFVGNKTEKTPFEWLAYACEKCNVKLGVSSTVVSKMANGETKFSYTNVDNVETYRDMISYVASLLCAVAMIDRNGQLIVKQFGDTEAIQDIPASWRFTSKIADYITKYSGIYATYKEAGISEYYHLDNDVDLVYNLGMNPFLQISDSNDREKAVMNVLNQLGKVSYVPFEAEVPLDPSYDPMDIFTLSGNQAIGEVSCITEIVLEINGSMSIKCVGENPSLDKAKSRFTKNIEGLIESQEGLYTDLKNGLDRLLFDYNTSRLEVGQNETTIGLISYQLIEDSDLGGHFLCTFRASTTTHLTIRFYDNEAEELYSPVEYDLNAGDTTIGIPHSFIARKQGPHRAAVTAQCESGTLSIDIRKVLFTIDGGYLASREIDVGMDIQDLSIRQVEDDNGPDEIWTIGLDEGEIMVRKRKYEESNPYVGFDGVINLGHGKVAAIEFDGEWVYRPGSEKYTIETDEWPWYFWTDKEDILWGQQGEDEKTRVQLATDVVLVKACKGFSSIDYLDQDQGLVVAYLKKDGTAWYRQRIRNPETEVKYWVVGEEQIGLETWSHISVTRLNDYRISFQLSNDTHNLWMYTDRTFVGQSVPPEIINLRGDDNKESFFCGEEFPVVSILSIDEEEFEREYEDSEGNKKYAVLTLNLDQHLANRGEDLATITYGEGSLKNNIEKVELNKKDDTKLEITTKKATVLHSSYGVIFNPNKACFVVVKSEDGYSTFNRLYMYVDKKIEVDGGTEKLILPTVETQVILRELGHFKGYENEVLNLNEVTNPVIYTEVVKKRTENKEELTLPTVSQTIIYLNSGGQPI